jgi:VCBS repeat-containing protein
VSDQVNVGDYSLEISGDEVVVRDESGAIVETVELDDVNGELTLPDGQKVDLASILADAGVENFQTAAGPANDNLGSINGGPGNFTPFHGTSDEFGGLDSAGALGGTALGFNALNTDEKRSYDPQQEAPVLVTWSPHDPWSVAENQSNVSFGKIVNGNPADFKFEVSDDRFEVVDGILQLRDGVSFDYETEAGIELEITATSRTGDKQTLSVHIDVTDVNETQTDLLIDATAANENVAGAVIGNISVVDPDQEDDQSFQLSDERFEIVDGQLKLKDGVSLDHESEPTVDVTVTATDSAGHQITKTFTVNVADVNEAPVDIDLSGNTLVENVAGAVIGTLTAIDPDAGDSHSFEVSDPRFEVVNGQLKLKDGQSVDFETEPSLDVVVTATDSAGNKVQETFSLSVGGVNEAQTALMLDQSQVSENAAGAVVGTLSVADPDVGDTQSFEVSDDRFEVVDGQLKLKDGVSLDRESEPSVNVEVTATDSAGHQIQQTFTINVGDVNEGQTGLALAGNAVAENAAGAVIGALTVTDPDAADSQSFQVSDARFEVVDGQLKLKDGVSLNYEAEPTVNVEVTATDGGGNQIAQTFTINVGDVNEAQTAISLSKSSVAENAKGAVVGTVLVVDPDAGDKQSYSVSDSRFQIVNGQLKLKSGVSINYEAEPEIDVTVTAKDKSGHQISQTFTIDVTNVNEKQTAMTLSATKVTENDKGAVIGTLSVSDPDAGDVQSYKVSDNRFEVVNGQLKLKDGVSLNYESAANVNVKVTATDAGGNQIAKTFTVNVQDINEAQTAMTLTGTKVAENAAGATIGTLKVTDPDKGDSQSYSVSDARFEVVNGQLKLKDGVSLNYEQASKVSVGVTATDSADHQITKTFSISVGNVNEAQTAMTLSASKVTENAAGAVIGTLKVTDPDAGDKQSFTVSDSRFEVVNNKLQLKPGVSLDYEQGSSVNVDVTATDKGGNQITSTFTINVGNVNEAQTALTLDNMQVSENASGAVIGKLSVADQDAGDTQSFTVSDNRFEVVNGELKLKPGVSFDHETTGSVDVTVTATDGAKHSISQTFTIAVGDVNEAQTGIALAGSQVAENAAGAVIGKVSVTDPDAGDLQSFQVSDSRFEVVDGSLKLKDGASLDHESEPNVDVTVTATDKGGHQIQQTFSVAVGDVNEAPLSLTLVTDSSQLLVNGSFEANKLNNGQWQLFNGITGWKTNSQVEIQNNVTNKASDGAQVVEMDADKAVDVIYQDVKTTAGHVYELSFDTATRKDTKGTDAVEVYWNGVKIGTVDPQSTAWQTSTFKVVGTGGDDRLEFREVGGENDNYGGLLDNVSLKGMGTTVAENISGVVIGTLQVTDPDAGDSHSFQVSDSRFEVVDGQLKLKADASLDYEAEPTVNVTVTATDSAGHSIQQTVVINVANVNEAPSVASTDGTVVNTIVDTSESYDPQASDAAGDYLYGSKGSSLSKADISSGVSTEDLTVFAPTDVTVTFQKEGAGYHNMVGVYQFDDNGNVVPGSVEFVWLDATASKENTMGASLSKDFLGYSQSSTVSLGTLPEGTHLGFFTIANGASDSGNTALLTNAAAGAGNQAAAMDAIASQLSIKIDANGNGHVYVGNSQLNGETFFTHNKSLNTDFNGSSDINHAVAGVSSKMPGQLLIGFEDLKGGGDQDYNDLVISVGMGTYNVNKMTQSAVQPTVDFSDVDGSTLTKAVIHTTGFQAGDALNVPPSADFDVTVNKSGDNYDITIVGKSGTETLDQYEDFANSIFFSTSSKTEGDRHIDYSVTDSGGLTSNVSSADVGVANSYEISSSELANGKNTLGSGDDVLHINTSGISHTNMGDGHDTVHLAQNGASFGHNEAVKLDNVEAIDTTGYGNNNVSLSINDVLNMTDGDNRLTIVGDQGDTVRLTSNGGNQWNVVESNAEFTTYAYSDPSMQAVVEISNQLNAQVS